MKKSILITGCSSGIGLDAALTLSTRGYQVFATARKQADVVMLQEKGLTACQLDLTQVDSIHAALAFVLNETGGTLDFLFNLAEFNLTICYGTPCSCQIHIFLPKTRS